MVELQEADYDEKQIIHVLRKPFTQSYLLC